MLPDVVYVVLGSDRDYSSGDWWCVAVYADREMAETHARLATEDMQDFERYCDGENWDDHIPRNEAVWYWDFCWDRAMEKATLCAYPVYTAVAVPFRLHPDEYLDRPPAAAPKE